MKGCVDVGGSGGAHLDLTGGGRYRGRWKWVTTACKPIYGLVAISVFDTLTLVFTSRGTINGSEASML